ncbi:hypothetical protein ACQKMD_00085 [Viridibacillus sp. NPDC096237]|uniref:hypothetical protein n=1 Tax=Viridibacillus sp. NPDC096237 TaxID=3390721 RepID=UPI003D00E33B
MFRNEPNSTTKFALFGCPGEEDCNKDHFEEVISLAIWTQKGSEGRPLKETFTFTAE